ncbi:hypothetical protein QA584_24800 [Anaerocolumna sp. AGMB13025]|uniref:nucleoside-diphosphate sugar epimerase/dehydratase n=1 Tax=Anaerocolumna sp. AGMB13025 TaxID=3039116 RepID=UPI0024202863|nr:hypothetical protein [Anaerocolumna sp. AGMB13025]WFR56794.1 hypothetical protein QA584_24800 [Anaerocolumna sp. AGMB13025]
MYVYIENDELQNYRNKEVLLFGAGSCGLKCIEEFEKINAKIVGFCDNNRSRRGEEIKGYKIWSPEDIVSFKNVTIMITSTYEEEIKIQLKNMGFTGYKTVKIGALKDTLPKEKFFKPFITLEEANEFIYKGLVSENPFFIGRFGSVELECLVEYYYLLDRVNGGKEDYHDNLKNMIRDWAGFFPPTKDLMDRFSRLYIEDAKQIDMMWSMWLSRFENMIYSNFIPEKPLALYDDTAFPINIEKPWTRALRGKRVLVIHPFEESIQYNYKKRDKLFANNEFLPEFELITLKAVQSIAGTQTEFATWFNALEHMERQINSINFDIALIGAGAYGFPLAAYVKHIGKKAIHVGGMLQLYFGIKGKAWNEMGIYNEHWTSPTETERPEGYKKVEAGRYW